jgi:putative addiction module CopG family antidote
MNIDLSAENRRYVRHLVEAGAYSNEGEVLDEAVTLLRKRDELRADVLAGIREADRGEFLPAAEVFARLEQRARQIEEAACRK